MIRIGAFVLGLIVFYFFDHAFKLHFPLRYYVYAVIVLAFGILFSPLYRMYDSYDKVLHLAMPIFGCIVVFYVLGKSKLEFKWKLLMTLFSMVFFLTILEVGEYLFDLLLDLKLQGVYVRDVAGLEKYKLILDRNDDTMIDLILGLAGTLIFITGKSVCYFYNKRHSKKLKH